MREILILACAHPHTRFSCFARHGVAELSHQQSREIEQHHARHGSSTTSSSAKAVAVDGLQRAARRTADEFQRFTATVYDAAKTAVEESLAEQERRRQYSLMMKQQNPATTYLDDFGIPKDDSLLQHADLQDESSLLQHGYTQPFGQNPRTRGDFVEIPRFRRPQANAEGWGAAANLDLYFTSLYSYFYHRGMVPLVCKGVVSLLTLFMTLALSIFLFVYVDWKKLILCIDESTCESDFVQGYIVRRPFSKQSAWTLVVALYILIFSAYTSFAVWSFFRQIREALQAKWVFEERLGIPAHRLEGGAVEWDRDVVEKLVELQASGEYRIAIHGKEIDALVVANRILRKENFLVALFNRGLLDLSVPFIDNCLFCPSIELSLYFSILSFMFNHKYHVRPAFYLDPGALRRRFILCGVAHAIFMPFLLFFLTLHFGLQNAYDWKSTKQYLGPRDWSLSAKWRFREFNELPHVFERRLAPSHQAAEGYLKLFGQKEIVTALGRILVFVGGSLGAVLVGFAAINDAILLHVKIADWNLLWYAGIVGVIYSTGKSMIPSGDARPSYVKNMYEAMDNALANVATHTHYYPDVWLKRGWDKNTHAGFTSMYKFKAQLFMQEILAAFVAPYVLCVSLPPCAESICEFVLATKTEISGAGEVCGFATFDFDKFGDESWEGRTLGKTEFFAGSLSQSIMQSGDIEQATRQFPKPRAREGKMEKSFFSFKASHPQWKCPESGQQLVDRVAQYQREETAALSREQQLHIEAAARQLETLARLEEVHSSSYGLPPRVDDSHIPRVQAPADEGAGAVPQTHPPPRPPPEIFAHYNPQTSALGLGSTDHNDRIGSLGPFALNSPPLPMPGIPRQSSGASLPFSTIPRQASGGSLPFSTAPRQSSGTSPTPSSRSGVPSQMALSAELRRILNMSTLDADVSVSGSLMEMEDDGRRAERQYLWLQRYHTHLAAQNASTSSEPLPRDLAGQRGSASSGAPVDGPHTRSLNLGPTH